MKRLAPLLALCALAGCGGAAAPRLGATRPASPPAGTLVAALGDSITAGSPLWDPDPAVRAQIGPERLDRRSQYELWARRAQPKLGFRNCGVFGERTDEIARRLGSCVRGAEALVVQGGINDIAQGRSIGDAARDLSAMVTEGRRLGLAVALTEVLPWNNGYPRADPQIRALNRRINAIGRAAKVPVYRWYARLEDPRAPGRMKAEWTIDGDHPSVTGYRRLARDVRLPSRG
jgi:lysophospholipase L1-like esterase